MNARYSPLLRHLSPFGVAGLLASLVGCAATWPADVEFALRRAGPNRSQLEHVLDSYRRSGDSRKLLAAQFLIANMPEHGFVEYALRTVAGEDVSFDALNYPNFAAAQAALDALEKERGTLDFQKAKFVSDLQTITADTLSENIELAFEAWRTRPWARALTFTAFLEHVLPYRGSNEPINSTRRTLLDRYADLPGRMKDASDMAEAARLIETDVSAWVGFDELYYLHPTDQSFEEMSQRRKGRCEDITNMQLYALRACAVAVASDYTPWWADRDNNHAWSVALDARGRGRAGLSNRAAKIYRKTYSRSADSLGAIRRPDEAVPPTLTSSHVIDATDQYLPVSDVVVQLDQPHAEGTRFAYLCVFNGGEWRPIHWGRIAPGSAARTVFTRMGRNIAYLPAYFEEGEVRPAAPPFILTPAGTIRLLDADAPATSVELSATIPTTPDADTRRDKPLIAVESGKTYELFAWQNGWRSLGRKIAGREPVSFDAVPAGRLLWLVADGSRKLERIFTIEEGRQVFW
ncbi:hypothetical protein RAS1_23710 [Phycisphaerae bacterium RAS1]|nr:hypothetical protein RAS1_23710 [Phycisphaerae bacterium RAS1]